MRPDINLVDELTLGNFKCFSTPQRLPFRPITLLYGPNGAGKTSVIQALKWLPELSKGTWTKQFGRFIRNYDFQSHLTLGLTLSLETLEDDSTNSDSLYYHFSTRIANAVRTFGFEAELTGKDPLPIPSGNTPESQFGPLVGAIMSSQRVPLISRVNMSINGAPFLELEHWMSEPAITTNPWEQRSFLHITRCNDKHPIIPLLIQLSKDLASRRIARLKTPLIGVKEGRDKAQELIERLDKLDVAVRDFDLGLITPLDLPEALEDTTFDSSSLPLMTQLGRRDLDLTHYSRSPDESISFQYESNLPGTGQNSTFDARSYILDQLRVSVILLVNFLHDLESRQWATNPFSEIVHLAALRSIPDGPFLLTDLSDRQSRAPDWHLINGIESIERQIQHVNTWLASLNRKDTAYKVCASQWNIERTMEGVPAVKVRHLRFEGIMDRQRRVVVPLSETGTGLSQLLPILLAAFSGNGALIAIQQPELHLHPALQSELGDLFIARALGERFDDKRWNGCNQFVLETHSEHLLLRIMRRIRETARGTLPDMVPPVYPDDVSILYIDNSEDHTVVRTMPLSDDGQLLYDWPGGFFEEGLREVLM